MGQQCMTPKGIAGIRPDRAQAGMWDYTVLVSMYACLQLQWLPTDDYAALLQALFWKTRGEIFKHTR